MSPNFSLLDMGPPEVATPVAAMTGRARRSNCGRGRIRWKARRPPVGRQSDGSGPPSNPPLPPPSLPGPGVPARASRLDGLATRTADRSIGWLTGRARPCGWSAPSATGGPRSIATSWSPRTGRTVRCRTCSNTSPDRGARGSCRRGTFAACTTSSRSRPTRLVDPERPTVTLGSHRACTHERGHWPNVRSWCELDTRGWRK